MKPRVSPAGTSKDMTIALPSPYRMLTALAVAPVLARMSPYTSANVVAFNGLMMVVSEVVVRAAVCVALRLRSAPTAMSLPTLSAVRLTRCQLATAVGDAVYPTAPN